GPGEGRCVLHTPRSLGGTLVGRAGSRVVAGVRLRLPEAHAEVELPALVGSPEAEHLERHLEVPDRLLVRESRERLRAGSGGVLERFPGVAEDRGRNEVAGELGAGDVARSPMELLESEAHPAVKPGAIERRELAVEGVADEHVREAEMTARAVDLLDDA